MNVDDLILVSIDDHVVEPPDMFLNHVPAKYKPEAPIVVTDDKGVDQWMYQGRPQGVSGLNAVVSWPAEEWGRDPAGFAEMRPGVYDVHERVRDMNRNGILASMCFPTFTGFSARHLNMTREDVTLVMVSAYNDWHIDEWCGTHPGRFIPCPLPAVWDPEVAAAEVRRTAAKGAHSVTFSENPSKLGWPSFHSDAWDPLWTACSDEEVVVCLHIGSSSQLVVTAPDAPIDCLITLTPMNIVQAAVDLVWSPVLRKFPKIKFALSEGGIGWIPYLLERLDYNYQRHHRWTGQDFGDKLPSEVFNEHVLTCFIDDRFGMASRAFLDMDNVMWECDYPHSDSTWPFAPETLYEHFDGVSDHDIDRVTHLNAMRHFHYDPFTTLGGKENCTVAALRAKAAGHDVSIRATAASSAGPRKVASADLMAGRR